MEPTKEHNQTDTSNNDLDELSLAGTRLDLKDVRSATGLVPENKVKLCTTEKHFKHAANLIRKESIISIDTETAFFKQEPHDIGKLALIQISLPEQGITLIIDPKASVNEAAETIAYKDLSALREVLEDASIKKIAHNADFETEALEQVGIHTSDWIDTQEMIQRLRADIPSKSLKSAVRWVLGLEMDKEQQTAPWHANLEPEQLLYAALDPELTYKLYLALSEFEHKAAIDQTLSIEDALAEIHRAACAEEKIYIERLQDLPAVEADIKFIEQVLAERYPGGSEKEFDSDAGYVSPGKPNEVVDPKKFAHFIREKAAELNQPELAEKILAELLVLQAGKTKLKDAICKLDYKGCGFRTQTEVNKYISKFMHERPGAPKINIDCTHTPQLATPTEISVEQGDAQLIETLRQRYIKRLEYSRDLEPELALIKYRKRAYEKLVEQKMEQRYLDREPNSAPPSEISNSYGRAYYSGKKEQLDAQAARKDLLVKLAPHTHQDVLDILFNPNLKESNSVLSARLEQLYDNDQKAQSAIFDGRMQLGIKSKDTIAKLFKLPEFEVFGFNNSNGRSKLWQAVCVPGGGCSPTRVGVRF